MLMHFLNNACSVIVTYFPEQAGRVVPMLMRDTLTFSDGMLLLGAGLILLGIGALVLRKCRKT
jgi:LPXTG-motif cell wall-anchored protein